MKKYIAIIIGTALLTILVIGFILSFTAYYRSDLIAIQGRELLGKISDYKVKHGEYPNQEWFAELGPDRFTIENRIWTYFTPPMETDRGELLMMSAIDFDRRSAFGFAEGFVLLWPDKSVHSATEPSKTNRVNNSEQDAAANP